MITFEEEEKALIEEEEKAETPEPEKATESEPESKPVVVAGQEFKSVEDALKSFENLRALKARQDEELGELRKKVSTLEPTQEEEIEFDPYDPDSLKSYAEQVAEQRVRRILAEAEEQQRAKESLARLKENNPDLTPDEIQRIADFGDRRGIHDFTDAYFLMKKDDIIKQTYERGREEALKGLNEDEPPPSLNKKGSPGGKPVDYDSMTPEEWANLTEAERRAALEDTPFSPG
jgi:exonuclease VII small subunit